MRFLIPIVNILFFLLLTAFIYKSPDMVSKMDSEKILNDGAVAKNELPYGFNSLFAGSGECGLCHSSMVNNQGESVSIINDWRSSMMANAAKDPFWRAKVSHEGLVNPDHAAVLEDVCSRCHAPMGHFNAHYNGVELYSIADMESDPIAMDGVSCTVCHQITEESLGNYSGEIVFGENKQIWGPYEDPFPNPMVMHTGYTPVHSPHIKDSRVCASCHTLITNSVDLSGNPTGTQFVEQAIYHEWLNSTFQATNISCQSCHIPEIQDEVVISTMPPWLDGRTPFGKHQLVGANVFMLRLLRDNIDDLGLSATVAQFDTTISRATQKLQVQSLIFDLMEEERTEDTLYLNVSLQNIAGHKLPSGYPSRRVFVTLEVTDASGDPVFYSGTMDEEYNLLQEDEGYEPHHAVINDQEQVQIYEMVMGNVDLEVTTILEQAYIQLKDNRIPPPGFTTTHFSYDTIQIMGDALQDNNFNEVGGTEGSGKDVIHYRIPTNGAAEELNVTAKVYYQTVSNRWLEEMFEYSSTEIDAFKSFYEEADKEPVLMAEQSLVSMSLGIDIDLETIPIISPNPAGEYIHVKGVYEVQKASWYNINGTYLGSAEIENCESGCYRIKSPVQKGYSILKFHDGNGQEYFKKLILR